MHYEAITEHHMIYNQGIIFSSADSIVLNSKTKIRSSEKGFSIINIVQRKHRAAIHVLSKRIFRRSFIPVLAHS